MNPIRNIANVAAMRTAGRVVVARSSPLSTSARLGLKESSSRTAYPFFFPLSLVVEVCFFSLTNATNIFYYRDRRRLREAQGRLPRQAEEGHRPLEAGARL